MGMCTYTLTKALGNKSCGFNIKVSNERRNNKKSVSYTKQVDVEIGGTRIRLFKGRKVQVHLSIETVTKANTMCRSVTLSFVKSRVLVV